MKCIKKFAALLSAAAMIATGFAMTPAAAEAANTAVTYESCDIASYWTKSTKTAPTKTGYVFGGWYTKSGDTYTALKEADITTDSDGKANVSGTYAKYVPAQILSVKAQNASGTAAGDGNAASVRVISALDSTDYQKVGFKILVNNKNDLGTLETTEVFIGLKVEGDSDSPYDPDEIFGAPAEYLSVWRLDNIIDKYDAKIINVTPYWITMDGTKVEGLSKYVHVEDGYMGYISIPVNLCEASKSIAAGKVTLTYPTGLTLVEDKVEFDGVFQTAETAFYDDGNGTVKIVGNAETVNTAKSADGIMVNLRFTADSATYPGAGKGTFLSFPVADEDFCDWSETDVSIDAWDIQY